MDIKGAENLSAAELAEALRRGARVVEFRYVVSVLILTFRRSALVFVPPGSSPQGAGLPYTLLSLAFGWWGFPFGLIFTPIAVFQNLSGGTDHTARYTAALPRAPAVAALPSPPASTLGSTRGSALVRVYAPDGASYPAEPLGRNGDLVHVRFPDGTERWVPAASVRSQ